MADQVCYLVPGFLGSKLIDPPFIAPWGNTVWFKPWSLQTTVLQRMAFSEVPENDNDSTVEPREPLADFYGTLLRWLGDRFSRVVAFGYDFRKGVSDAGSRFLSVVSNDLQPGEVATFIGHSMGGLVSSACIRLGGKSLADRVRNFITLGTPFGGSIAMVEALRGTLRTVRHATLLSYAVEGGRFFLSPYYIRSLLRTWPGAYDLLPPPSVFNDQVAAGCFNHNSSDAWASADMSVHAGRLARSITDREANRHVPAGVLHTAIIGTGLPSPMAVPTENIREGGVEYRADGDGTVPVFNAQAFISDNTQTRFVPCDHMGLLLIPEALAAIDAVLNG